MKFKNRNFAKHIRLFWMILLLIMSFSGMQASAAAFQRIQVGLSNSEARTKVGGYYFWGAPKNADGSGDWCIFTGKSKTGKGKALAKVDPGTSRQEVIMTDGKTIVYPLYKSGMGQTTLYSIRVDGTKKTKYNTVNDYINMIKQTGTKCYYSALQNETAGLYCLDLKTKKVKKIISGKDINILSDITTADAASNIYVIRSKSNKINVSVIDSQKGKSVKTCSLAKKAESQLLSRSATGKYCYLALANAKRTKVTFYRMPAGGGKWKQFSQITLKKSPVSSVIYLNDSFALFDTDDMTYYKYTFKNKKISKFTGNAYQYMYKY